LAAELIDSRLEKINRSYLEIEKGLIFQKITSYSFEQCISFFRDATTDLKALVSIFSKILVGELRDAFGKPGIAGDVLDIKLSCDRLHSICKELLAWEFRLHGINLPEEFKEIKELMKGWTKPIFEEINRLPKESRRMVNDHKEGKPVEEYQVKIKFEPLQNVDKISSILNTLSR